MVVCNDTQETKEPPRRWEPITHWSREALSSEVRRLRIKVATLEREKKALQDWLDKIGGTRV